MRSFIMRLFRRGPAASSGLIVALMLGGRALAAVLAVFVVVAAGARTAQAATPVRSILDSLHPYLCPGAGDGSGTAGCDLDPVNLLFINLPESSQSEDVAQLVQDELHRLDGEWGPRTPGSAKYFVINGSRYRHQKQLKDYKGIFFGSNAWHVRFLAAPGCELDIPGPCYVVGAAHFDDLNPSICPFLGDVSFRYAETRERIRDTFDGSPIAPGSSSLYRVQDLPFDNTDPPDQSQCPEAQDREDGLLAVIDMRRTTEIPWPLRPDLVVTSLSVPSSALAGETVSVSWRVENQGDTGASQFTDQVVLSTSPTLSASDDLLADHVTGGLSAGASSHDHGIRVTLPAGLPPGTYYLGISADVLGQVAEHEEANNTRSAEILIAPPPPTPGDVDKDGDVDVFDGVAILLDLAGFEPLEFPENADVDGDGDMDTVDALHILRSLVGLSTLPP